MLIVLLALHLVIWKVTILTVLNHLVLLPFFWATKSHRMLLLGSLLQQISVFLGVLLKCSVEEFTPVVSCFRFRYFVNDTLYNLFVPDILGLFERLLG